MKLKNIIKCPCCGAEYLPEEIFYPDSVFNNKVVAIKDEDNKIILVQGDYFTLEEEFECEYCGCNFKIKGDTNFSTEKQLKTDFEEETVVDL